MGDIHQRRASFSSEGEPQRGIVAAVLEVPEGDRRAPLEHQRVVAGGEALRAIQVRARHAGEVVGLIEGYRRVAVGKLGGKIVARHSVGAGECAEDGIQNSPLNYGQEAFRREDLAVVLLDALVPGQRAQARTDCGDDEVDQSRQAAGAGQVVPR